MTRYVIKEGEAPRPCTWCGEMIVPGECGVAMPHVGEPGRTEIHYHADCFMRSVIGPAEHIVRHKCDGKCQDDPRLTRRQAARAAVKLWTEQMTARNQVN